MGEIANVKSKYELMIEQATDDKEKFKDELKIERILRTDLQEKLETCKSRSIDNESEILGKEEKLQLVEGEVEKLQKLVAKKQKENEKAMQDFEEKTEKLQGFLTAGAKEIEKYKENERILRAKEQVLQEKLGQLNATMITRETKLKEMGQTVAEAKEKLETKENIFAEKIKKMQEKLDAALCPSTDNDQVESNKRTNENLRNQLAELNRKLLENKKAAEEYLRINKEAVCSLKIQKDANVTLEARVSTLEAQLATQTGTAE